jgi:thiol:disulfide interchange protein
LKRRFSPLLPVLFIAVLAACGPAPADAVVLLPGTQNGPALVPVAPSAEPAQERPAHVGAIAWETSDSVARERAKTRGAPLLVFVFAAWSTAALRTERTTLADPRVIRKARTFVALRLDVTEADANAQAAADGYELRTRPSIVLLDHLGHEITRLEGYAGPDDVLAAMRQVLPDD